MRGFTVEVPSNAEIGITGFQGSATKTIRNRVYRVECWASGWRCFIDSQLVSWERFGTKGRKLTHDFAAFLKSAQKVS